MVGSKSLRTQGTKIEADNSDQDYWPSGSILPYRNSLFEWSISGSSILSGGGDYTMGLGIPTPRHRTPRIYPPRTYPVLWAYEDPLVSMTPGGYHWRHTTPNPCCGRTAPVVALSSGMTYFHVAVGARPRQSDPSGSTMAIFLSRKLSSSLLLSHD